jgi:hypothetical protein
MSASIFHIAGQTYVSGLFWQPLTGDANKERPGFWGFGPSVRKIADRLQYTHAVWRQSDIPQIGFSDVSAIKGSKSGSPASIALLVCQAIELMNSQGGVKSFIAAVEIPEIEGANRWLLIRQREGVLMAEGDLLVTEDECITLIHGTFSIMPDGWDRTYAPEHWDIRDSNALSFNEISEHIQTKKRLLKTFAIKSIKPNKFKKMSVVLLPILFATGAGLYLYLGHLQEVAIAERNAMVAPPPPPPPPPWEGKPQSLDVIEACRKQIMNVPYSLGTWYLDGVRCVPRNTNTVIVAQWLKDLNGTIRHLKDFIKTSPLPVKISPDGMMASMTQKGEQIGNIAKGALASEDFPDANEYTLALLSHAEHLGFKVKFNEQKVTVTLPGQQNQTAQNMPASPVYNSIKWSIDELNLSPFDMLNELSGAGFFIDSIKVQFVKGTNAWSIEGVQYVK